ncbi:MAG: hypothetical protein QM756_39000 [Polyangiaceae bacterium]
MNQSRGVLAWVVLGTLAGCSTAPETLSFGNGGSTSVAGSQSAGGSSGGLQGTGGLMLSFGGASQSGGSQGQGGSAGSADAAGGRSVTKDCAATMVSATDVEIDSASGHHLRDR